MIPVWLLATSSVIYIAILFAVAWYGDKRAQMGKPIHNNALIYSLSFTVYCSSWSLYGSIGQAATSGWDFLSLYIGPIIFLLFFWKLVQRIIRIAHEKRLTSIADFIGTRYGKDGNLAKLVTLVAILVVVPYIALQLKSIAVTFELVINPIGYDVLQGSASVFWEDTAFYVSIAMMMFVIVFGTRNIDASEQHPGMMLAVASESLVKISAMLIVGFWVMTSLFNGPTDLIQQARTSLPNHALFSSDIITLSFILQSLLAAFAIICLPRQFQVVVIENGADRHIKIARWVFSIYLVLMLLAVIPIALAGQVFFSNTLVSAESYLISLPLFLDQENIALIAFLGGTTAGIGMIIMATIAISIMISNELVLPALFRQKTDHSNLQVSTNIQTLILFIRRIIVVLIIGLAYIFHNHIGNFESLAALGLLAFSAAAQFAPALIIGMFWQRANRHGSIAGILGGALVWITFLLIPLLTHESYTGINEYRRIFNLDIDYFSWVVIASLLVNISLFIMFSFVSTSSVRERMLAIDFISPTPNKQSHLKSAMEITNCKVDDVRVVLERILGLQKSNTFFASFESKYGLLSDMDLAPPKLLHDTEELLASIVGSSSARVIVSTLLGRERIHIRDLTSLASEASNASSMSREQLQAALENLQQGVSVVDRNLNLVAWNQRYLDLFNYPKGFIHADQPIAEIIAFNAQRGFCGDGNINEKIARRVKFLSAGSPHQFERELPTGVVLYMQGHPMPDGGFVTSFTDISIHRKAEQALKETNISLEKRVEANSQELAELTSKLIDANTTKTRFLAAANHDLMQPLNAAKLFASTLSQQNLTTEQKVLLSHLEGSLQSAEDVLSILVEISKLDAGVLEPQMRPIALNNVLKPLQDEFTAIAAEKGLQVRMRTGDYWVLSDPNWLRRILQNLLSNAVRYTNKGGVLLGCRKRGNQLVIEVWDSGSGIPKSKIHDIFREFKRLHSDQESKGLGLGLAIVDRMAKRMNYPLSVDSWVNAGSRFSITLPLAETQAPEILDIQTPNNMSNFTGVKTFVIDNDQEVLAGMNALLNSWKCDVFSCHSATEALNIPFTPQILLADYQLDNDEDGLTVMQDLRKRFNTDIPGILITANPSPALEQQTKDLGFHFMKKPVKPAALRALIRSMIR